MKNKLDCEIVNDLLPSYIDKLTSEKTTEEITEHLSECESCRQVYRDMTNSEPQMTEQPEVDYLKKINRSRRRVAIIATSAVLVAGLVAGAIFLFFRKKTDTLVQKNTQLAEEKEQLLEESTLPAVTYDPDTKALVITGTGHYDGIVIPDEAEEAVSLD